ncbi:lambda-exonuclease family protein [Sphingomonas sp.]|jgi:putative phage-type endonuclease|uniref:lambda-exonuclease family protein n=1 Tax=Sphingomonas sp. TaxID=28214 RepID=UPI003564F79F
MKHLTHNLVQGTQPWLDHRAKHLNSSELAAVMGISSYKTRNDLLKEKATGYIPEVDATTQKRFDDGHKFEAIAREWAEEIVGTELYPASVSADVDGMPLAASLDGIDMAGEVLFEHKMLNKDLAAALENGIIPDEYHPQMEQALLITGASKCLFMASSGDKARMKHAWYLPNPKLRTKMLAAWHQFASDVNDYKPAAPAVVVEKKQAISLPSLAIVLMGEVKSSNLAVYRESALAFIENINTDLQDDDDFAQAEQNVKDCERAEKELALVKKQALAQTVTIDDLFKVIDQLSEAMRQKRLMLDKLVKSKKETIRMAIEQTATKAFAEHVAALNAKLGKVRLPEQYPNFAAAMRSKKTLKGVQDAVDDEMARAKIEANQIAAKIEANLATLRSEAKDHAFLFVDAQALVQKEPEDLLAVIKMRIDAHVKTQADKLEADRAKIRAEERKKLEAEQVKVAPAVAAVASAPGLPAIPPLVPLSRPTDLEIINCVAERFNVSRDVALLWISEVETAGATF